MRAAACLAIVGFAYSPAVWGQSQSENTTGSIITRPKPAELSEGSFSPEELGRMAMVEFARCEIDLQIKQVRAALALGPGEDEMALRQFASEDCLKAGDMRFVPALYRGALFGELYRRHVKGRETVVPIEPLDFSAAMPVGTSRERIVHRILLSLADCIFQQQPDAVRSVILNKTGSPKQKSAYATLLPAMPACVPTGQKLALSRSVLEGAFGEYLYRSLVPVVRAPAGKVQ